MAVMASHILDKAPLDSKPLGPSPDVMSISNDLNGLAPTQDALFDGNGEIKVAQPPIAESHEQPAVNGKATEEVLKEPAPTPLPTEDVTSGIAPIASFLPDPTTTNSDPITEIPAVVDQPLSNVREDAVMETTEPLAVVTDAMDTIEVDAPTSNSNEMQDAPANSTEDSNLASEAVATQNALSTAASTVEVTATQDEMATKLPAAEPVTDTQDEQGVVDPIPIPASVPQVDEVMTDALPNTKVRPREEDDADDQPLAKRAKTEEKVEPEQAPSTTAAVEISTPATGTPTLPPAAPATSYVPIITHFDSDPMTDKQKSGLLRVLNGAKKAKPAAAFKEPVDHVALNIPMYPEMIKNPMDLRTMEMKLKDNQYGSVDDFIADVNHIVRNAYIFNGPTHPVTQAGVALEAYMAKVIKNNAVRAQEAPPKAKPAPSIPDKKETRRRSTNTKVEKPVIAQPTPSAASPTLYAPIDGVPIIRRDSTANDGRPKREIQRPKPRDLPYSVKPRKKKFQVELKFCEMILNEVKKQKHAKLTWPFLTPVDPVALNIPTYHKIVKKPMDLSTMEKKLKQGDYQTSKDFRADFDLMFANCFKFNPENDEIHKMGKGFQELVNELWSTRDQWINDHQPQSDPVSSAGEESDEEEEASDDEQDSRQRDLFEIQRKIAELTNQAQSLISSATKASSPKARGKKSKSGKVAGKPKKISSISKKADKPKKKSLPPLTFQQKQEISESIGELGEADMGKAMQIIRNGCPDLSNGNDEELEIDMEQIPEDVLRQLYKFVRNKRPSASVAIPMEDVSDDEFEPPKSAATKSAKTKKNKPMNKKEQEDNIQAIKRQLEIFKQGGSGSEEPVSPANQDDSSSDDDADSESEEE